MYDVPFYISLIVTLVAYILDLYQNIFKKCCKKSTDGKITDPLTMLVHRLSIIFLSFQFHYKDFAYKKINIFSTITFTVVFYVCN